MRVAALPLTLALTGCVFPLGLPKGADAERITIETDGGYCMFDCDWYRLQVTSDGRALLRVYHNRDLLWGKDRRLTPGEFAAFETRLAPYRPVGDKFIDDDAGHCEQFATDLGGYHVQWEGRGPPGRLALNDGCIGPAVAQMRAALTGATPSLGFKGFPGTSDGVAASTMMPPRAAGDTGQ